MVELKAPPDLAAQLQLWETQTLDNPKSRLWTDLLDEDHDTWHDTNASLASAAVAGDDDALAKLVMRDPRYLGTEYVQARILESHLILANARDKNLDWLDGDDKQARATHNALERRAQRLLDVLARSIKHRGKGKATMGNLPSEVVSFYERERKLMKLIWDEGVVDVDGRPVKVNKLTKKQRAAVTRSVADILINALDIDPEVPDEVWDWAILAADDPEKRVGFPLPGIEYHVGLGDVAKRFGLSVDQVDRIRDKHRHDTRFVLACEYNVRFEGVDVLLRGDRRAVAKAATESTMAEFDLSEEGVRKILDKKKA